MRNAGATHNLTAISATNSEASINTFADVDLSVLCDMGDVVNLTARREDNSDEANGKEEPDTIYDNGFLAETSRNHNRAQPQHFAYLYAYGLGRCVSTPAGSGYLHTITPLPRGVDEERELPSMTMLCSYGETVLKRRLASFFVDQVTATFAMDDWVKISGSLTGTGKYEDNLSAVTVSAAANATTLTLPAQVEGSSAEQRLDSIHRVQVELTPGVYTEVKVTAASDADPAVLTIEAAASNSDVVVYKVLYVPKEGAEFTFPPKVVESNLRVSELTVNFGGTWNGTAFDGGRPMGAEIRQIVCELNNNSKVSFVPGGGGAHASMHERGGRTQSVKFDRKFRDYILQQHILDNDTFGLHIKCVGKEFDTGHHYQVEIIYPRVGVLAAPLGVNDKKLTEAGEFVVLDAGTQPSIIVRVKNKWAGYAQ